MNTLLGWSGFQWLAVLAGMMAILVTADAFVGHYRSGFALRAQYTPFVSGGAILVAAILTIVAPAERWAPRTLMAAGVLGVALGIVGVGYHHYYGITTKPGGYGWLLHHLMHHAPPLAPLALSGVGALAMIAAEGLLGGDRLLGIPLPALTLVTTALALAGAAAQAALLHYRGAFNNPLMYAPLTTPLLAAAAVPWVLVARSPAARAALVACLWLTFLVGFLGLGMHLRGFDRMMGGLRVALPNLLEGPAAAAPALFAGFAAAGLVALHLL